MQVGSGGFKEHLICICNMVYDMGYEAISLAISLICDIAYKAISYTISYQMRYCLLCDMVNNIGYKAISLAI